MEREHSERFRPLDGIRGLAIVMVLAVHSFSYSGTSVVGSAMDSVARAGWIGVTLFFVLSGFLITGILLDTSGREHFLRDFYARRALRIFPLYFAFLAVYLFLVPELPYVSDRLAQPPTALYYWTYLANMQEWFSGIASTGSPLGPLWSLAVEEQIYLVWPFLILLVARRRLPVVWVALAVASVAWRVGTRFTAQSIEASYAWSPANLEAFAAGAFVAWLLRYERQSLAIWAPRAAVIAGVSIATLWTRLGHFNFWSAPVEVLTIGTSAVVALFAATIGVSVTGAASSALNRAFSGAWLCACGKYSYAIYLFHSPVMELLRPLRGSSDALLLSILMTAGVAAGSLGAAFVSWHVWEAPFLSLKRYFPSRGELVSAPPDSMVPEPPDSSLPSDQRRVA